MISKILAYIMKSYLICVCILSLLSACSAGDDELRLSTWVSSPSETALFEEVLDGFRNQHPEVLFKYEPIPGNYSEKLQLMLGTRTAPDIFYLKGMTAPSYMSFGILNPLDSLLQDKSDLNDFYPFALDAFNYDGVQYGLPKDFNPYVLFYNKALFAEAGIEQAPQNWEELKAISRKLSKDKDGDGKTDQFGFIVEPSVEMVMPFVYQNGGAFQKDDGELGITDPEFVEALEFYYGLYKDGEATLAQDQGVAWNGDAFGREICAMAISGGWLIPFLKDNYPELDYGIAILPRGKQHATVAFITAYAMPKASNNKEDAWEIVDYLVSPEGMKSWTSSGVAMPTRRSVARELGFEDHPVFSVFMKSAEFAKPFQVQYSERGFEEIVVAFQAIFYTNKEPREAMEDIRSQIEKYRL